jgi:HK97 family phage major capsid protein
MPELKETIDQLTAAFAEFKKANDERLKEVEAKGKADPLLVDKVDKLNTKIDELDKQKERIDQLEMRANRGDIAGDRNGKDVNNVQHREAFGKFMRKGLIDGLRDMEVKAGLSTGSNEDGGFAVPVTIEKSIIEIVTPIDPMRELADVVTVGAGEMKELVDTGDADSGWVGEEDSRDETDVSKLKEVTPYMGELYANPKATQTALDDIFFDAEAWIAKKVGRSFAKKEAAAFITGDGVKKPRGFLNYPVAATEDDKRAYGTLQYFKTGVAGGFAALNVNAGTGPADVLIDVVYAMKEGYLPGAVWVGKSTTFATVRKLKDAQGNYLWQPGIVSGEPANVLGYPVRRLESMPAIAANSLSLAFGNFMEGYRILDRMGTRVLRDPYTKKPYVQFYTTKRVGGCVINSEAIKLLKFAA